MALRPSLPIVTERLLLRAYTEDDYDAFASIQSRDDVHRYLYTEAGGPEEIRAVLRARMTRTAIERENDAITLALELRDGGALAGDVSFWWRSAVHQTGEIGFLLHPDHHGRGYAREAAEVMLRLGFEGLDLHRVIGRCDGRNAASARLMERLGMRREAHLRENEWVKGEWTDELVYAILRREWEARRDGRGYVP